MSDIPGHGWYVEVDANNYTHVAAPADVQGGPTRSPSVNGRPEIRIPVDPDGRWAELLDGSNGAPMRVWHDGERQPIDTLFEVDRRPGETILIGDGGEELGARVQLSYDQEPIHEAVDDIVTNGTTYTANVDTPPTTTRTTTLLDINGINFQDWVAVTERRQPTDPWTVDSGFLELLQSTFTEEAEAGSALPGGTPTIVDGSQYSGDGAASGEGQAVRLSSTGDGYIGWDVFPAYRIPAEAAQVLVRARSDNQPSGALEWRVSGPNIDGTVTFATTSDFSSSMEWRALDIPPEATGEADLLQSSPGINLAEAYSFSVELTSSINGDIDIDVVAPTDVRVAVSVDNTPKTGSNGNRYLNAPGLFPPAVRVRLDPFTVPEPITDAEVRYPDTFPSAASIGTYASNDQGDTFAGPKSGTPVTFSNLGASHGPELQVDIQLSSTGSRDTATPGEGFGGLDVFELEIDGTLEDMPILVNDVFDNGIDSVLSQMADRAGALWEYRRDGPTESVEWTTIGQRTTDRDPAVSSWTATKSISDVYQEIPVYGQSDVTIADERFVADHGTAVTLVEDRIQPGSEVVQTVNGDARFSRGPDYRIDYQTGEITALSNGRIPDGELVSVDYQYQAFGIADDGSPSPSTSDPVELPALGSDFLCRQTARILLDLVSDPLWTAEVTLPNERVGWSVVDAIDPSDVPGPALYQRSIETTPDATILSLGSRRSFPEAIEDLQRQLSGVSRKA
jgi:hypothetical protein